MHHRSPQETEHLRIVCASDGANHAVNFEGPLRSEVQIDRGLIPIPGTYRSKGCCHLRGRKNSESLTIGRVKKLWTADDICGDLDSSL